MGPSPSKAWRSSPDFDNKYLQSLKKNVKKLCEEPNLGSKAKILMLGPVQAGKSSVIKTIDSVFVGRITGKAITGSPPDHLTSKMNYTYNEVLIETLMGPVQIYMCDTKGIDQKIPVHEDLIHIIQGNIKNQYVFSDIPINLEDKSFIVHPKLEDQIHCVVFVFNANTIGMMEQYVFDTMNRLQATLNRKDIPRMVLITHVDILLEEGKKNVSEVFFSKRVERAINIVSQKLGIPSGNIMPFVTYEKESVCMNDEISCLALQAFEKMVGYARDFLMNRVNSREKV